MSFNIYRLQDTQKLTNIEELFPNSEVYLYPYARFALLHALKSLCLKAEEKVYLPSLICSDMLSPIQKLQLKPVFYEVDESLNAILDLEVPAKVVLAVNYFGS